MTDPRAAAAHMVGVLWASTSQGVTVKELRTAVGLSRERLEDTYEYLLTNPPLGLAMQRHGDELPLVTAPEVCSSVERHLNHPKPVPVSNAAREVLAIVAYRQLIARSGIEHIRGSASDSAIATLEQRGLTAPQKAQVIVRLVTPANHERALEPGHSAPVVLPGRVGLCQHGGPEWLAFRPHIAATSTRTC